MELSCHLVILFRRQLLSSNHVVAEGTIDLHPARLGVGIKVLVAERLFYAGNECLAHGGKVFGFHAVADVLLAELEQNVGQHFNVGSEHAEGLVDHCVFQRRVGWVV